MRGLLVTVLVLAALAAGADRVALAAAQSQIAAEIQSKEGLADRPSVSLDGFPFLTQAIRGRYDGGRLEVRNFKTEKVRVDRLVVDLRDVSVPLANLVSGDVGAVPVGSVSGVALVTYADLAAATGIPGLRIGARGDKVELTFPIDQFGTQAAVVATARIGVADQAVRMTSVKIEGVELPEQVTATALSQVQSRLTLGVLPYGLKLTDVRVAETGIEVSASARNTVIHPPSPAGA